MSKNLDLTDKSLVSRIISEIEKSEERERKTHCFDAWQIYSGNQRPYVLAEIQRARPQSWPVYTVSDVSVAKMAIDKVAKAYKESPVREVISLESNAADDIKSQRLYDIYREANAKIQLPFLDTINNLHKYALMWVNYNQNTEKYQFMALNGFEYSIIRDKQTGELLAVILNYGNLDITSNANSGDGVDDLISEAQADSSAQSKVYAMWSRDNFVVVVVEKKEVQTPEGAVNEISITYVDDPNNMQKENKLGVIPFVFVAKEPTVDFPTKEPLPFQSVVYNYMKSETITSGVMQGAGVSVLSYPEKLQGKIKTITTGLTSAIELPQSSNPEDKDTSFSYISPSPDLAGMRENDNDYLTKVLEAYGINAQQALNKDVDSAASGIALAIKNSNVQHLIEQNQQLYGDVEKKMFKIIVAWENFLGRKIFSDTDELSVVFKKPKLVISDSEELANIEKMLSLGLIEEHEKFMYIDPNMSEQDAKDKLDRINKSKLGKVSMMRGVFSGEDNESNSSGSERYTTGSEGGSEERDR